MLSIDHRRHNFGFGLVEPAEGRRDGDEKTEAGLEAIWQLFFFTSWIFLDASENLIFADKTRCFVVAKPKLLRALKWLAVGRQRVGTAVEAAH